MTQNLDDTFDQYDYTPHDKRRSVSRRVRVKVFAHTHLVRGGSLMLQPTDRGTRPRIPAYPPRERWSLMLQPTASARSRGLQARTSGTTSHEVGMQKCEPTGAVCRLEHQGPTSHEVGMQECGPASAVCRPERENLTGTRVMF